MKVTDVKDKTQVGGKSKQDVLVAADESGRVRVTVWESHANFNGTKQKLLVGKLHGA